MGIFSPNKHRNGNLQRMLPPVGCLNEVPQIFTRTQSQFKFPASSVFFLFVCFFLKKKKIPCKKCQPGHFWLLLSAYINSTSSDWSCPTTQRPCLHRPESDGWMHACHRSSVSAAATSFPAWSETLKVRIVTASSPHFTALSALEVFVSRIDRFSLWQAV